MASGKSLIPKPPLNTAYLIEWPANHANRAQRRKTAALWRKAQREGRRRGK